MGRRKARPKKPLGKKMVKLNAGMAVDALRPFADVSLPADFKIGDPVWLYVGRPMEVGREADGHLKIKDFLNARAALGE